MFVFIVMWLWGVNRTFPSNWLTLGALFIALIPVALLFRWLTEPRSQSSGAQLFFPMPKLVVIAIGATIAIVGYIMYDSEVNAVFYSDAR